MNKVNSLSVDENSGVPFALVNRHALRISVLSGFKELLVFECSIGTLILFFTFSMNFFRFFVSENRISCSKSETERNYVI